MSLEEKTTTQSLLETSPDNPSIKMSTAVFVRNHDSKTGESWIPAEVLKYNDGERRSVDVVLVPENGCDDAENKTNGLSVSTLDLSSYPNQTLPLQEVNKYGERAVHADLSDMHYLHEAGILYNLKDRHVIEGAPYTRAGCMIVAMNPYKWMNELYHEEVKCHYADRLVWETISSSRSTKDIEPHLYEISALAYKGLIDSANDGNIMNQAILVSGESGSGKTESVKILMNHLAILESTKDTIAKRKKEAKNRSVDNVKITKGKRSSKRLNKSPLKKLSSVRFFTSPKDDAEKVVIAKMTTDDTDSSMSSTSESDKKDEKSKLIVNRIAETNNVLEAFGNAKTSRNDNSSRFGKFVQLQFDVEKYPLSSCKLVGSFCETYLLEKSRVVSHLFEERTFHIFYQLLAATDDTKVEIWEGLTGVDSSAFKYVGETKSADVTGISDANRFEETLNALKIIGLEGADIISLMRSICAVMQLGNISFKAQSNDGSEISSPEEFQKLIDVLEVNHSLLKDALTTSKVNVRGETFIKSVVPEVAKERCDSLAKAIYSNVFEWLVSFINKATTAPKVDGHDFNGGLTGTIGLLDIFGFECFKVNRFEQLLINHANEKLQVKFTEDVFVAVQEEYKHEGVPIENICFPDNSSVVLLLEGKSSLMSLLNEECVLPKGNDCNFVSKIFKSLPDNPCLYKEKCFVRHEFGVSHFAGKVKYEAKDFVLKNQDYLHPDLISCAATSSNRIISEKFVQEVKLSTCMTRTLSRAYSIICGDSVWGNFKAQLDELHRKLCVSQCRYVRCINPNLKNAPRSIELSHVLSQIRCSGIVEATVMSRQCYPNRLSFEKVIDSFGRFANESREIKKKGKLTNLRHRHSKNNRDRAEAILKSLCHRDENDRTQFPFVCGKTLVYFRAGALESLEDLRLLAYKNAATIIQSFVRKCSAIVAYKEFRRNKGEALKKKKKLYKPVKKLIRAVSVVC